MNDASRSAQVGRARPETGSAQRFRLALLRIVLLSAGPLAAVARAAIGAAESGMAAPLLHRAAGIAGVFLEVLDDPCRALLAGVLVTTIAGSIAAWRRSVGAGVTVAATLFAALGFVGQY